MKAHLHSILDGSLNIQGVIEDAWEHRAHLVAEPRGPVHNAVTMALSLLDDGMLRIADRLENGWRVNDWLIRAIMLGDLIGRYALVDGAAGGSKWWDKDKPKFADWGELDFSSAGFRAMPGSIVRYTAHIGRRVILNPCFVSWGARVDEGSTIDAWVTVGSCAQVGQNVHVSAGVCLGGVIEPMQTCPVIIEDDCFIGANCSVVEGMIVGQGSVIGAGTVLSASTKIVDRLTGQVYQGHVPPYSVAVPGSLPGAPLADGSPGPLTSCAVIIKRVDASTRAKTSMNDIFRS